jgi:hypothetical protein
MHPCLLMQLYEAILALSFPCAVARGLGCRLSLRPVEACFDMLHRVSTLDRLLQHFCADCRMVTKRHTNCFELS